MALTWERPKDPSEIVDYSHDWTADLGTDTISTSTWSLVNAAGVSIASDSKTTVTTRVFLSGGTHGETALLLNTIVTAGGRTLDEAFSLAITDKAITAADPTEAETLATRLSEAKSAYHTLMTGAKVVDIWRDGRRITYDRTNASDLLSYIQYLEGEIVKVDEVAAGRPRRRPINLAWHN